MTSPTVSVVIPVGSCDDMLRAQLDALAVQVLDADWEIVLACNTTDAAERAALDELAALHERARVIDASDVRSASYARNQGAAAAEGDVLAFCDGDDIAEPGWLAAIVGAVEPMVAVGGHLDEESLAVPGQENWRPPATPGELPRFLDNPYLVSANMACSRSLFEQAGGFDLSLIRCEDIALSFQMLRAGAELRYVPDAVVQYRHRAGLKPMLHQHYLYGRGMAQVLRRDGLPDDRQVSAMRPNGQKVEKMSIQQFLRRASLGVGRLQGATIDRWLEQRANA